MIWKCTALMVLMSLAGCAGTPQSTALTMGDLNETTSVMSQKLAGSQFLAGRTADSERMVIAISKVENLSSDLISEGEQWMLMDKVRLSLPMLSLGKERNIAFVIPAEQLRKAKSKGTLPEEAALARHPTHEMAATFRSGTRSAKQDRTDEYLVEYRITDLKTGTLEWDETFEFKRAASGRSYD